MAQEIYHIRLNTGEDLISEVTWPETKDGHEAHIVLHNPMKIVAVPSGKPGFVTLSLMQWIFAKITKDKEFNVFSRDILTMSSPTDTLKEYYKDTVGYFAGHYERDLSYGKDTDTEQFFDELEKEINSVVESDKKVEETNEDMDNLRDIVAEFLNSLAANNRGTLH